VGRKEITVHKQGTQPSPTNAGTYRGENAGDGDKGQASPRRHSLGFYKIRKKEAPGDAWKRDQQRSPLAGDGGFNRVTPQVEENTRGRMKAIGRFILAVGGGLERDDG
jgi:hypothetical protein